MKALRLAISLLSLFSIPSVVRAQGASPEVATEVDKGVKAYNAGDIKHYQSSLADGAVYIADDGMTFAGKERILALFTRLFAGQPAPQIAVSDVTTTIKGDVAWARFKWTLTKGPDSRKGLTTTLFTREAGAWKVAQIQDTPDGHGAGRH
jgi:uncharacterized protein (TIGR02246 family)